MKPWKYRLVDRVRDNALAVGYVVLGTLFFITFVFIMHARASALSRSQAAPPAAPSLWIEQLGSDGEVTSRRDVARLVFSDGTTMDCAALFTTPPARPLGSDVQTIGFEIPSSSLRVVFDLYRP